MPQSKKYYLFANWKMYLDFDESNILANALALSAAKIPDSAHIAVFPGALALYSAGQVLRDVHIAVGAQNFYWVEKGGYTGEISAAMYKATGCEFALVGHSERRHVFGETNHDVRQKTEAALAAGLTPVVCVGETGAERAAGKTEEVLEVQLRAVFDDGLKWPSDRELIIAYEPVWAIGTGKNCQSDEANRIHGLIKKWLKGWVPKVAPKVLYGGSVRADDVAGYLKTEDIDGVLVGAASTKLDSWIDIMDAVSKL